MSAVESASTDDGRFPLSAAQLNIYFAQKIAPDVPFTVAQYVEIRGEIDPAVLIRATDIACRDLESPGVRLTEVDGRPLQWFDTNVPYAMIYKDLRHQSDPVAYAQQYMDEHHRQPVDLVHDQLIVSEIIQVGDAHYFWYSRAHHVVMDGLGAISVQERTAAAYTALITDTDIPKTRAVGVREIYDYEASYVDSSRQETDRRYWQGRLEGHADAPRLARSSSLPSGVSVSVGAVLDNDIADAMADVARRYNSSDVPVVLAAFSLYLARMTDTEDVMLSLPVSGRATTKLRDSSGMMSNIVPLRVGVDADITVEELLRRIQVELTGALRHQRFRVEDMQRSVGAGLRGDLGRRERSLRSDLGRPGAFGPTVNIMMYDSTIRLGDVVGEYRVLSSGPIDDMMVNVYPGVAGSSTRVDFLGNPAVYTTDELAVHHARFLEVLTSLVAAPDGLLLSNIRLSYDANLAYVEDTTTVEPVVLPTLLCGGVTLHAHGVELGPADFVERTEHVAAQLIALGAGQETRVASALERSELSVLVLAAIAAAGASYVPIDPREPAQRLDGLLVDAGVSFGIASRASIAELPGAVDWLAIEDLLDANDGADAPTYRAPPQHLDNEAYVIHTSGSTGKPKAVSVTHRGLAQLAATVVDRYHVTSSSRVLHLASPVFDASIQEILAAFAARASLVVAPADVYAGRPLAELTTRTRITHLITSPSVLATLQPEDLRGVEVFDVGGEDCPPALRDRFAESGVMLNAYGPTETTVLATLSDPMTAGGRITIGTALPGVRALVLDTALRPTPHGGTGELYLGGEGVARGYVGRPGLTAARFVADPGAPGQRLYRTGDIVRSAVDGSDLEYVGRRDGQIQLHGRRLELGEVEAVATTSAGVTAAVADVRDDRITLYVTGTDVGLDSVLRTRLPGWMVPQRIVVLDALPLTASGKVDRRALPSPTAVSLSDYVAPQSDTEKVVAGVFADVLGVADVGRDHTFFELGGDSLSATRVIARLGSGLTLPTLFDTPSVTAVAAALDAAVDREVSLDLLDTVLPERVPLSYSQQRLWFLNQFDSSSPAYNMPVGIRLAPGTDVALVVAALRDVLERHESLRTYFPDDGDGPRQVVLATSTVLTDIAARQVAAADLNETIEKIASTGFDVAQGLPLRAEVLETADSVVAVIVLHHIAVDGWSVDPLVKDFAVAHAARTAGHAPTWGRLPAQYSHYAVWNRAVVDAVADDRLRYWTSVLDVSDAGEHDLLAALPTDRPRPAVQSMVIEGLPLVLDADLVTRLHRRAQSAGATTFMIVHAALAATLSRFTGSTRTVIGSPTAGRGHPALDDMVGMFVGTVPLAVTVDPDGSVDDLVTAVRRADLDAFAHAELPFERIVDAVATDRSLDRHPLFQVMLAFDNAHHESLDDLPISLHPIETRTSEFDLNVVLAESEAGISGRIEYAVDLYDEPTVAEFASVFLTVLRAVVTEPTAIVGDLQLAARSTEAGPAPVGTLLDVLATVGTAIDGDTRIEYDELDRRSNRLARLLIAHGVGPESVVALSLERSAEYVLALWAIVKSGAAFAPIDPHYPAARREKMLDGIVIGVGGDETGVTWVDESEALMLADGPIADGERTAALRPDHPAYVIHTSGSTGTPKPVTVTHASVYALAGQVVPHYAVTAQSRVLQGYSVNFDAAVLELVLAFGAGATLVIAPRDLVDGDEISRFLTLHGVTHYLSTPAVLATVPATAGLTTVAVGGDVLGSDVVRQWAPGHRMLNAYGPTEATVVATLTGPMKVDGTVTIGRPLDYVTAHVLDRRLTAVPVGGVGELYLGGAGLARGYGTRAALTAERFVAGRGGTRLYRTGDLVRVDPAGELQHRGRIDSQVQLRGVRVELGDIESTLASHPDVRGAVAAVREDRILAWVVGIDELAAKQWLFERLPLALVPATVTTLDRIPLTGNGKVDLAALETPVPPVVDAAATTSLSEDVVLGIFADSLGVLDPAVDANFFALGGDSLAATRVANRIGAALGTHVPVRTVFEAPTARLLAAAVEKASEDHTPLPVLAHHPDAHDFAGLAPAEQRIWWQNRYDPNSAAYNIAFEVQVPPEVDLGVLREAVGDVLRRHLPLRTVYPGTPDGPTTTVLEPDVVLSSLDERHADAQALATDGFDLTVEPPVRFAVTHDSGTAKLTVAAHHIAVDGLSLAPLARDVETALRARIAGTVPQFDPLAVDYADYRRWQRDVLSAVSDRQLDHWRRTLASMPGYLDLPTGNPDPNADAEPIEFGLDSDTLDELRTLAHRLGATVFVLVHAALAVVLAEASGTTDIAVGTPVSGRSDPQLDALVGMFVGTVVLRTEVDPSKTFEQFVLDVREVDLDAFGNADVPFERVVDAVSPTRSVDVHPLFQVLLAFGDLHAPAFAFGSETATPRRIDVASTQFDLEFVVEETADGLAGRLTYSAARFARSVTENLATRLLAVLTSVAAQPGIELGSAQFRGRGSTIDMVHADEAPESYSLGAVFAGAAEKWSDRIAVVDGDVALTYRELDERSNMLAHALVGAGVAPGDLVAVVLPRSIEFDIAVWAVAKVGAAYLPIDPQQPAARIDEVLVQALPVIGISGPNFDADARWLKVTDERRSEFDAREVPIDAAAYVVYTSGSTGTPKGVRVTQRGIADLVQSQRDLFGVRPDSRVLRFASPSFDAAVFEMLLAVGAGAASVIVAPGVYGGRELEALVEQHEVTHACLTPTVLQVTDAKAMPTLAVVVIAGEAVNSELLHRWSHGRSVFNAYGPTEATVMSTCTPSWPEPLLRNETNLPDVTIGGPTRGFDAVVLDARLRPVGDSVVGELYLGGRGLAEGYIGQAGATSSSFVADPFVPGRRLYRTGDLARWTPFGGHRQLEYVGRVDSQVKIRGHRVELFEVEAAVLRHPNVEQASVVGRGDALAAYVVGSAGPRDVRAFVAEAVPGFMVPNTVTVVDSLPTTLSGKVDVRRLPEPTAVPGGIVLPTTALEFLVRTVFADVLEMPEDHIGIEDNFFDLGGHSLQVVRVMDSLADRLGQQIPVTAMFVRPTVAGLARHVESDTASGSSGVFDVLLPLRAEGIGMPLFCIHPAVGIAWSYLSLLAETDRPVYGLQVPGIADGDAIPSTIDGFATRYVREIRSVQQEGPYHLLGWSLGGVIAHAVAARLQEDGEDVALLALVDARLTAPDDAEEFGVEDLASQLGVQGSSFDGIAAELHRTRSELSFVTADHLRRVYRPVTSAAGWVAAHRVPVFKGDVDYLASRNSRGADQWKDFVGGVVSVHRVDADHEHMLGEAGARAIGRVLGTPSVTEGVA
ncbi:non-ribosomal peptide synthetase [Rhodococcus sp. P1Y]|uniref:non-ribosomal peptide synthetase n=1 Tax=Rhodococcus sp. P1Y TaxID=1302308 RepID=UPI000EADB9B4|nr:non-ribosomal peptide synthetase [Rhodococcus sp. P1Y]AYJ48119.1 non-ribosomal peptide synthetase [Rhodococcus sp. P1Y]